MCGYAVNYWKREAESNRKESIEEDSIQNSPYIRNIMIN